MSKIQRNNTVIDPSKSIDLATAISKYTSGGVILTDAIAELAKSLTILLQDQMGYSNFSKRYNSCKFDLHRECFYYVGHHVMSGEPIEHVIHEWQTAGDDFTFADGERNYSASRKEIRQFAKDLPGFLEKLQDDLMSSAAESEGKASMIACLADRLRECNLIILKRQQDQRDRGPSQDGEDDMIEPFVEVAMQVIGEIDEKPEASTEYRHAKYANLLRSEMRLAFQRGVAHGKQEDRPDIGPYVDSEDNQLEPFLEAAMNAINRVDEADHTLPQPYRDRHSQYAEILWDEIRNTHRHGVDQGAAAQSMVYNQERPPMVGKSYEERIKDRDDLLDSYRKQTPAYDEGQLAAISVLWMEKELKTALIAIDYYKSVKDTITLSPSPCSSFTSSMLVEAKRIDMGDAVGKCPVCGAYMDLLRLTVAGTVVAYVCPNGHSYLFSHKGTDVDQPGDERTAAAYLQPLPGSNIEGPIAVIAERVLLGLKSGEKRLCGECEKSLDLVRIVVCDNTVAIIGVCDEGHTYLYPPSDFEEI